VFVLHEAILTASDRLYFIQLRRLWLLPEKIVSLSCGICRNHQQKSMR